MRSSNNGAAPGRQGRATWGVRAVLGHGVLVVVVLIAALPSILSGTPDSGMGEIYDPRLPVALGIIVGVAIALLARRTWPLPAFVATAALAVLSIFTDSALLVIVVGIAVSAYAMADATPRHRAVIATCAVAVALGVANIVTAGGLADPSAYVLSLITFAAAALGDSTRSRRELLHAALDRAERAEQTREAEAARRVAEERLRIARDLHDAVGHRMTVINLHAGAATASLDENPDEARSSLDTISSSARSVLTEIQQLLNILRAGQSPSDDGQRVGLAGLPDLIADLRSTGMTVALERTDSATGIDPEVDAVAFRVVQEALVNATRHGSGSVSHVTIEDEDHLLLIHILNDRAIGRPWTEGNGLRGMRERVEAVGGALKVASAGSRRFEVTATLPRNGVMR